MLPEVGHCAAFVTEIRPTSTQDSGHEIVVEMRASAAFPVDQTSCMRLGVCCWRIDEAVDAGVIFVSISTNGGGRWRCDGGREDVKQRRDNQEKWRKEGGARMMSNDGT